MASDPMDAFEVAQCALLQAVPGLTDLLADGAAGIVDEMSAQGVSYDYIEIGDNQAIGDDDTVATAESGRTEIYANVHVWCRGPDARRKANAIGKLIRDPLATPFALDGHEMTSARFFKSVPMTEPDPSNPDGVVAHLVVTHHYRTQPTPP